MRVGLIAVDSAYPNFALMKLSAWHKAQGDEVEWYAPFDDRYDIVYLAKVFTFTPDFSDVINADKVVRGGTGYDVRSRLPREVEESTAMDYSLYPKIDFSIQFFSRGCVRHCPFCLVHDKEGGIHPVTPVDLNRTKQKVNLQGVDIRLIDDEQCAALNKMRLGGTIHIAWDLPQVDLTESLRFIVKRVKAYKWTCYILVGFNSTIEQDMYRIERCRELGIKPYVMPYRDYDRGSEPSQYAKDLAQYVNKPMVFKSCAFKDFQPRNGFRCEEYFTNPDCYDTHHTT